MNYKNGSVIGINNIPTVSDASGVWDLDAVQQSREDAIWPVFLVRQLLDSSNLSSTTDPSYITKTYTFNNGSEISGTTGRFVVHHYGTIGFQSDAQYDDIVIPTSGGDVTFDFEIASGGTQNCETTRVNVGNSITAYAGATFYALATGGSANRWNRDSGGTGSFNTGNSVDGSGNANGYYVYTETSGSHPMSMLFRTPSYTLASSGTFSWREGYRGSQLSVSTRDVYWIVD